MRIANKLTLARGGIVTLLTVASLTLGVGVAQADRNIPARSKAAIRNAQKKQEANGGHSIEVICEGKVSKTGSCGGGYTTYSHGIPIMHGGAPGGANPGSGGQSSVKSHNRARHNLFPRRSIRR
ncbi:MAG TPA: hypothetical protein VKA50_06340 [Gammaproteobacteria bacterium]|nr:hypothetical protein [Gammaproteobacteria bacterium]